MFLLIRKKNLLWSFLKEKENERQMLKNREKKKWLNRIKKANNKACFKRIKLKKKLLKI